MNLIKYLAVGLTLFLVTYLATVNAASDVSNNAYHPALPVSTPNPPIVAAFYYPWYGNPANDGQWINWPQNGHTPPKDIASDYYPLLGAYSTRDQTVLAQHMDWLHQAHVDLIIVSWWGQGSKTDQAIPDILTQAASQGIKVAFHLEPYIGRSASKLVDDVAYLYAHYGNSPSFFRTASTSRHSQDAKLKGLFFLYLANYNYAGGTIVNASYWQTAIDQIHALPDGGLIIGDQAVASWIDAGHFDGEYAYTSVDPWPAGWEQNMLYWANKLPHDAWFIPSVLPGFSASRVGYAPGTFRSRDEGRTYERQWKMAMQTGVTPKIIAITSFNEWHEGSQIEPASAGITNGLSYTYTSYNLAPFQYLSATAANVVKLLPLLVSICTDVVSVTLKDENTSKGLYQHDLPDGLTESVMVNGRDARKAITNTFSSNRYVYFWVNDDFHYSAPRSMRVSVEYLDTSGSIRVEYDSTDTSLPAGGASKATSYLLFTGTNQWLIANFDLPDAYFGNRQNNGADLRISGKDDYIISRVTVSKLSSPCHVYLPILSRSP